MNADRPEIDAVVAQVELDYAPLPRSIVHLCAAARHLSAELARVTADRDRLRDALKQIAAYKYTAAGGPVGAEPVALTSSMQGIARAALAGEP